MILAKLVVDDIFIKIKMLRPIPKGVIGAVVEIEYASSQWQSLKKTVVFHGCVTKDVVDAGTTVEVPSEVVAKEGGRLSIGIYGTDAENNIAIPTLWCDLGPVVEAADPSGDESTNPVLPVWAQLMDELEEIKGMGGGPAEGAVLYTKQTLTEEQKAQARENIGVSGGSGGLSITDDGEGNVTITSSGSISITDDGNGNVVIA